MKRQWYALLLVVLLLCGCGRKETAFPPEVQAPSTVQSQPIETSPMMLPEPEDSDFVRILDYLPGAEQELYYATDRNFTGQVIYDFQDAYLRYGTVKKLQAVSRDLEELGLRLKIWDGFRPVSAQFRLWEACPDPKYVADPRSGHSSHSRGNTVDLTLVDEHGAELEMPTGFDDFSAKADRDYEDCTPQEAANAQVLELLMEKHGFRGYSGEWWHYSDTDTYPVEEVFLPEN